MGFTWEEAEVTVLDRHGWRRSVAQCVQLDAGCIKVNNQHHHCRVVFNGPYTLIQYVRSWSKPAESSYDDVGQLTWSTGSVIVLYM